MSVMTKPATMLYTFAYDGSGVALRREVEVHAVWPEGAVINDGGKVRLVPESHLTEPGSYARMRFTRVRNSFAE